LGTAWVRYARPAPGRAGSNPVASIGRNRDFRSEIPVFHYSGLFFRKSTIFIRGGSRKMSTSKEWRRVITMMTYKRRSISVSVFDLIKLYDLQEFDKAVKDKTSPLYSFVSDPVHFDYELFNGSWWPLFMFSDVGVPAMKYGGAEVSAAFSKLDGKARVFAERYADLYTDKHVISDSAVYDTRSEIRNYML
jgi:hypothetical protein